MKKIKIILVLIFGITQITAPFILEGPDRYVVVNYMKESSMLGFYIPAHWSVLQVAKQGRDAVESSIDGYTVVDGNLRLDSHRILTPREIIDMRYDVHIARRDQSSYQSINQANKDYMHFRSLLISAPFEGYR